MCYPGYKTPDSTKEKLRMWNKTHTPTWSGKKHSEETRKNKIESVRQAKECSELWVTENGEVLCKKCHSETDSYLKKLK